VQRLGGKNRSSMGSPSRSTGEWCVAPAFEPYAASSPAAAAGLQQLAQQWTQRVQQQQTVVNSEFRQQRGFQQMLQQVMSTYAQMQTSRPRTPENEGSDRLRQRRVVRRRHHPGNRSAGEMKRGPVMRLDRLSGGRVRLQGEQQKPRVPAADRPQGQPA